MKKAHILILILLFIMVGSTAGCQGAKTTNQTGSPNQTGTDLSSLQGKTELTSLEAAALAYQEAKKWHPDAALYYLMPIGSYLSPQWRQNDASGKWAVMFANPTDATTFNITIEAGKITRAAAENIEKTSMVNAALPVDRPGVTMKQAGEVVYANNAPAGLQPMILYDVKSKTNKIYPGMAVWTFGFVVSSKSMAETEAYIYIIDGQTGKLLTINDAKGNPTTPPAQLSVLPQQSGKEPVQQFLTSLGTGNAEAALALMDANMLG
ncbi:MAG: hypothetical protein NTV45_04460, partial [Firmicutes bacterium]|nr:hypothetical protein [Bacillota bacterium]